MKHKSSKRSSSNKQHHHQSYQTQTRRLSIQIDHTRTISPRQIDLGTGTVHLDSYTPCLKPNVLLKSQKLLKRDLLRCSNQRPSLLGPQILQPPRIHHGSQQTHSLVSSSSTSSSYDRRRRSLSINSHTFSATIDRIGPWPDMTIGRLRPDGNDLLRPLKNLRNGKNPRLFSPKYYAGLSGNTSKFQFHPLKQTYMEEYRKQKGYLLNPRSTRPQLTSVSLSSSRQMDDDQLSAIGTISGSAENNSPRERSALSITNLSLSTRGITKSADDLPRHNHRSPIISSVTNQINIFPTIPVRHSNNHLRSIRHAQAHHPIILPALTTSPFQYLDRINSEEKTYNNTKKKSKENQSKLIFIDGRQKKRNSSRIISNDSEVTSGSQDHIKLRNTSSPVVRRTERPAMVVVYQISRRTPMIATQNDIEALS